LLDREAQPVERERVLGAALLKRAEGIAHGLAGVAILARLLASRR
jgi:hypothetical protein